MISSQEELQKVSDKAAAHVLSMKGTETGTRTGWLMITTILIVLPLYWIGFIDQRLIYLLPGTAILIVSRFLPAGDEIH